MLICIYWAIILLSFLLLFELGYICSVEDSEEDVQVSEVLPLTLSNKIIIVAYRKKLFRMAEILREFYRENVKIAYTKKSTLINEGQGTISCMCK